MKTVLISGSSGFLESHITGLYLYRRDNVTMLDELSTGSPENLEDLKANVDFSFTNEDVRNPYQIECDTILNFECK